jgi:hypothetical protein
MDITLADQDLREVASITNNFNGPSSCTIFRGHTPHALHLGLPHYGRPASPPALEHRPANAAYNGRYAAGMVTMGDALIFGASVPGQMIRKVTVDNLSPRYVICDHELRDLALKFAADLHGGPYLPSNRTIAKVAVVLQRAHLLRPEGGYSARINDKLVQTQREMRRHLLEAIEYFRFREVELTRDWKRNGPGQIVRHYFGLVLAILQSEPIKVFIDSTGAVSPRGQERCSFSHAIDIRDRGIEFNFYGALKDTPSVFLPWEQLRRLPDHGMSFPVEMLGQTPMPGWFSNLRSDGRGTSDHQHVDVPTGDREGGAQASASVVRREISDSNQGPTEDPVADRASPVGRGEVGSHRDTEGETRELGLPVVYNLVHRPNI